LPDVTDDHFPRQPELSGKLARFRLVRKLAETNTSVVYLAEETDLGNRSVAIKVIVPALARDEILRAASLDHHNIVPVHFAQTDGELLYLVMPYVDGPNLRELLTNGPLDLSWTVHMIREVAAALDFAHAAGVVHRDVKPSNILVDRQSGRVLLCDFGIAAHAFTGAGRAGVGTPGFVAPELIPGGGRAGAPIDPRADVYSLGAVLYQCLTGRPPYAHSDVNALLWAQGHEKPRPVTALRPELPTALDDVLATALAKRPRDRHTTCLELADELRLAVSGRPVRDVRRTPRPKGR